MTMSMQTLAIQHHLAARRRDVFNERYRIGDAVMYIRGPGDEPVWERTYGLAYVQAGRSVVALAGQFDPVDTDKLFSPPAEIAPTRCAEARVGLWPVVVGFAAGIAATIAIALMVPPAKAVPPERIVIDCVEPGEMPVEEGSAA
jgi:hypothetical protein